MSVHGVQNFDQLYNSPSRPRLPRSFSQDSLASNLSGVSSSKVESPFVRQSSDTGAVHHHFSAHSVDGNPLRKNNRELQAHILFQHLSSEEGVTCGSEHFTTVLAYENERNMENRALSRGTSAALALFSMLSSGGQIDDKLTALAKGFYQSMEVVEKHPTEKNIKDANKKLDAFNALMFKKAGFGDGGKANVREQNRAHFCEGYLHEYVYPDIISKLAPVFSDEHLDNLRENPEACRSHHLHSQFDSVNDTFITMAMRQVAGHDTTRSKATAFLTLIDMLEHKTQMLSPLSRQSAGPDGPGFDDTPDGVGRNGQPSEQPSKPAMSQPAAHGGISHGGISQHVVNDFSNIADMFNPLIDRVVKPLIDSVIKPLIDVITRINAPQDDPLGATHRVAGVSTGTSTEPGYPSAKETKNNATDTEDLTKRDMRISTTRVDIEPEASPESTKETKNIGTDTEDLTKRDMSISNTHVDIEPEASPEPAKETKNIGTDTEDLTKRDMSISNTHVDIEPEASPEPIKETKNIRMDTEDLTKRGMGTPTTSVDIEPDDEPKDDKVVGQRDIDVQKSVDTPLEPGKQLYPLRAPVYLTSGRSATSSRYTVDDSHLPDEALSEVQRDLRSRKSTMGLRMSSHGSLFGTSLTPQGNNPEPSVLKPEQETAEVTLRTKTPAASPQPMINRYGQWYGTNGDIKPVYGESPRVILSAGGKSYDVKRTTDYVESDTHDLAYHMKRLTVEEPAKHKAEQEQKEKQHSLNAWGGEYVNPSPASGPSKTYTVARSRSLENLASFEKATGVSYRRLHSASDPKNVDAGHIRKKTNRASTTSESD